MKKELYTVCFMCSVRCLMKVIVEDNQVKWIEGHPEVGGSLCPRGTAAIALLNDPERLQHPMIRTGPRGSGEWRKASWDEALDYTADKLKPIIEKYGGHSVTLGERTQVCTHVSKAFLRSFGSENQWTHDTICKGSVNTACRSLFGYTDAQMSMDYENTKHIIMYGRNFFEAVETKQVIALTKAMEKGAKLTYIDPRVTITATKAHRYWMIRPGTDLALNYGLMNVIFKERLYDVEYVERWVKGLPELQSFVQPYTPEWAEKETGIPAEEIVALAREVSHDKPQVIFHFGYRGSSHPNEIYMRRSIMILNSLMGSVEAKGGFFVKKGPGEVGRKPARKLTEQEGFPEIKVPRFDKVGTPEFPLPDPAHGAGSMLPYAILNEDPYPVKALFAFRYDPLLSMPDYNQTKKALDKLDLIVCIDIIYSDIAHYSDVILPECTFLERTDCIRQKNGLKPQMLLRTKVVEPLYDTRPGPIILKQIAERLGTGKFFPYETMEDLVRWQLEPTGFKMEDFEKAFVEYSSKKIFWDRKDGFKFKTPSGKIEFVSSLIEDAGFKSFPDYEPMPSPPKDQFRLIVGRCAQHTNVATQNNPYLNEVVPDNKLWINSKEAARLGIKDGALVKVSSKVGSGTIKAYVTELIHPEAVFMLHGYGHEAPRSTRSYKKGLADAVLQESVHDMVGGSPALDHTCVSVKPV
jgi:thiosulfate reductase/polysulfide reductase chain A